MPFDIISKLTTLNERIYEMSSIDEQILRTAKEIVVKFIEVGRVSPTTFNESFQGIYTAIKETVKGPEEEAGQENKLHGMTVEELQKVKVAKEQAERQIETAKGLKPKGKAQKSKG